MTEKKRGAKGLAVLDKPEVEIVGKTPDVVADEERRIHATAKEIEAILGGAYGEDELADRAVLRMRRTNYDSLATGVELVCLKRMAGHGRYTQLLKQREACPRQAQRCVNYARQILGPDLNRWSRTALTVLGPSKLRSMSDFSDEELDALADGDEVHGLTLDKVSRMTTAELQKALRKAEKKIEDIKAAHDADTAAANDLKRENQRLRRQWSTTPVDDKLAERRADVDLLVTSIESQLGDYGAARATAGLAGAVQALLDDAGDEHAAQAQVHIASAIDRLQLALRALRDAYVIDGGVA